MRTMACAPSTDKPMTPASRSPFGTLSAPSKFCSMKIGDDRLSAPTDNFFPRLRAPSSGAATPTIAMEPNDGIDTASATCGATASPVDAVSRTNQSVREAPPSSLDSSVALTNICPPSPRHVAIVASSPDQARSLAHGATLELGNAAYVSRSSLADEVDSARNVVTWPSACVRCARRGTATSSVSETATRSHPSNIHVSTPR
mmetsp:Transcript_3860/g.14903  ORF Transcript_3860/g.14903 Transcript_3860/m.14903 type:complete len:202 (-) Transcript_3860:123-728(-)